MVMMGPRMPWNDTAQLNYLNPEVREPSSKPFWMLPVNSRSSVFMMRYDLSRVGIFKIMVSQNPVLVEIFLHGAEHGLPRNVFLAACRKHSGVELSIVFPKKPPLHSSCRKLLANGRYFVRTLGMHRVYNSAFMNMLRDEENTKFRQLIKTPLNLIQKFYAVCHTSFPTRMKTACVDQFGMGDKYFGVCTLMVTLPGLPMFGHGQIEGYSEKYGMEYKRAYYDEQPDFEFDRTS
jgi:hypothetical protein